MFFWFLFLLLFFLVCLLCFILCVFVSAIEFRKCYFSIIALAPFYAYEAVAVFVSLSHSWTVVGCLKSHPGGELRYKKRKKKKRQVNGDRDAKYIRFSLIATRYSFAYFVAPVFFFFCFPSHWKMWNEQKDEREKYWQN